MDELVQKCCQHFSFSKHLATPGPVRALLYTTAVRGACLISPRLSLQYRGLHPCDSHEALRSWRSDVHISSGAWFEEAVFQKESGLTDSVFATLSGDARDELWDHPSYK
jgi:hypothetical protein